MRNFNWLFLLGAVMFFVTGGVATAQGTTPTPTPTPRPPASITELADAGFQVKTPYVAPPGAVTGAFGANRMVYTKPGVRRLAGDFFLPADQSLGTEYAAPTYQSNPDKPGYIMETGPGKNTYKNKPTFYFGTEGANQQSDVGFQYEGLVANGLPPGWSAFSSVTLQSYTNRNPNAKQSVGNWYQTIAPSNRMAQEPGKLVHLDVSLAANGQFVIDTGPLAMPSKEITRNNQKFIYTPQLYPEYLYSPAQNSIKTDDLIFRRVIGMTQSTGDTAVSTGSFIHNLAFDNGQQWLWGDENVHPWITGDHQYQPPADNAGYTKTIDGVESPLFMVDSLPPWHRLPDGNLRSDDAPAVPAGVQVPSRYFKEGVNIDLLAPAGKIMPHVPVLGTRHKKQ